MELLRYIASLLGGTGPCNSCNALSHCLGAVGHGTRAMHCLTTWGQWAVELLQCNASLPWGSGQCNSCHTLPHCLGAVGNGTLAMYRLTAWGQWVVQLLQYTSSLPGGSGRCNSCDILPHCLGVVGSGPAATQCLTAWGQWVVGVHLGALQCNTLPHCLGCNALLHCGHWAGNSCAKKICTASPLPPRGQYGPKKVQCNSCTARTSYNTLPHGPLQLLQCTASLHCNSCVHCLLRS